MTTLGFQNCYASPLHGGDQRSDALSSREESCPIPPAGLVVMQGVFEAEGHESAPSCRGGPTGARLVTDRVNRVAKEEHPHLQLAGSPGLAWLHGDVHCLVVVSSCVVECRVQLQDRGPH